MATRIYPVKDLILVRNENGEIETDFQPLIDLIENSVASKTWVINGGTGMIGRYQFQDRCLLVVCQPEEVHEQIAAFLAALRRCAAADAKSGVIALPKRPKTVGRHLGGSPRRTAPRFSNLHGLIRGAPPEAPDGDSILA